MRPLLRLLAFLSIGLAVAAGAAPAAAPRATEPIRVAFEGEAFRSEIENGVFTLERFAVRGGKLVALGTVSGDVYFVGGPCIDDAGRSRPCRLFERSFSGVAFAWPVGAVTGSCARVDVALQRVGGAYEPRPWGDLWLFEAATARIRSGSVAACAAARAARRGAPPRVLAELLSRLLYARG